MRRNPLRVIWIILGFMCLGIGTIGVVIPMLPTVPFYMATVFFFAKSSNKLHDWFISTSLYKKHIKSLVKNKEMLLADKIYFICSVTIVMGIGFFFMGRVPIGRIILTLVWLGHIIYFIFGIKTIEKIKAVGIEK